jgi:flagellar basal-body rod protein FlgC
MGIFDSLQISASGLTAQRTRLDVAALNLANVQTTRTPEGGPYRRKMVVLAQQRGFRDALAGAGVEVEKIVPDQTPFLEISQPGSPDADARGMVKLPNVNPVNEMVDMTAASRSYEANLSAFETLRSMALKALEIGR